MTPAIPPPSDFPAVSAEANPAFDLRKVLQTLLKYKGVIAATAAVVFVLVAFWTLRQPKTYEAACSLEYDPNPPSPLGRDVEDVAQPATNFFLTREFYETQNHVIASRRVAELVVRKLELQHDRDFLGTKSDKRKLAKKVSVEDAANLLRTRIKVKPLQDTRIVQIQVRDHNPKRAAAIANATADAYIEKTVRDRLGTTINALEWLQKQTDDLRHKLDSSELALHTFKKEANVLSVSLEDRQNIVTQQIGSYSDSLTKARIRRIELEAKLEQLRTMNLENPLAADATILDADDTLRELVTKLQQKDAENAALSVKYGLAHPQVRALNVESEHLRRHIAETVRNLVANAASDLREERTIEKSLQAELDRVQQAGIDLSLREIEYQRLNRERENQAKLYGVLLERRAETNLTRLLRTAQVRTVDRAMVPSQPVLPRVGINLSVSAVVGLLLGILLAFALSTLDRTVKSSDDIESQRVALLGVFPALGSGSKASSDHPERARAKKLGRHRKGSHGLEDPPESGNRDLIVHQEPRSSAAECCRTVRTNLTFMSADRPLNSMLVTSAGPREGKTTVAVNLAIAVAQSGKRVLLIDTDMRRPRLHRVFGMSAELGISSVLVGERRLEACVQPTQVPNLFILACGPLPPNPSELLHTPQFRALVAEATERFDRVILDSPPLGAVTDAAIIGAQVDGAIFVVRCRQTSRDAMIAALRQLRDVGAHIVGAVLNQVNLSDQPYAYRGSYYQYYQRSEDELRIDRRPPQAMTN